MTPTKIAFFDTKPYDKKFFNAENENFHFDIKYFKGHLHRDSAVMTKGFDAVCVFVNDIVDREVINILKECGVRLIALRCAGYNNIELGALDENIQAVRVPEYSPFAVAEHAVALMLCLNRKLHRAYFRTRDNNFAINGLLGFDMHAKTVGIVGTGKIGRTMVPILRGFGMEVLLYDPYPNEKFAAKTGSRYVSFEELLINSDIISLHCPLTKENEHMINSESISKMKEGIMIINTGRGKLIDTKALIAGLKNGKVGAAGLDVYEEEGGYFFKDHSDIVITDDVLERLLTFPNVLLTSHQAFFTKEALTNIARVTLSNIQQYFVDKKLENACTV